MSCGGCDVDDQDATAVFMCLACQEARATRFVSCRVRGRPIVTQVCGGVLVADAARAREGSGQWAVGSGDGCTMELSACPRGPDDRGLVRWLGIRWRGVPWPVKMVLSDEVMCGWLGHDRPGRMEDMPGCGCSDRVKGWCERISRWLGWDVKDAWLGWDADQRAA